MLTITKKLDMSPHGVPQVIRVSQYDSDFTLEFKLFASGGNFALSTGTTAEIRGTKQSGTGYSASATLDTSTKVVTVAGAAQMTAVAGMNIFEIVLKKNNKEISSANFCLLVERAALDADTITDESVLKELNAIIESADTATQAAEEAEAAADRAEAAAQTLVIDSTLTLPGQPADAKATGDAIAQIVPGLSETAKAALLNCFAHVAWVDEHGQDYYDALYEALYEPTSYWDYEWYASSKTLPEGMTATSYDFTTENGAMFVETPNLDFDYVGDCIIEVECKPYAARPNGDRSYVGNNPQIVIQNATINETTFRGIKVILNSSLAQAPTYSHIAVGINGVNTLLGDRNVDDYHVYRVTAQNNIYSLLIDEESIPITQNMDSTQYLNLTGISTATQQDLVWYLYIKSIKFKRL